MTEKSNKQGLHSDTMLHLTIPSGGFRGGSGGSIEPPFLGNSKFLQFVPPKKFMCNFEPAYH